MNLARKIYQKKKQKLTLKRMHVSFKTIVSTSMADEILAWSSFRQQQKLKAYWSAWAKRHHAYKKIYVQV